MRRSVRVLARGRDFTQPIAYIFTLLSITMSKFYIGVSVREGKFCVPLHEVLRIVRNLHFRVEEQKTEQSPRFREKGGGPPLA